jgi:hypothetical protein
MVTDTHRTLNHLFILFVQTVDAIHLFLDFIIALANFQLILGDQAVFILELLICSSW